MNELGPFTLNSPDIGSIFLENNLEDKKVTNEKINNILMSSVLYEIKCLSKFQETVEN